MSLRRYYTTGDFINDMFEGLDTIFPVKTSYSFSGRIVDTDKYDILPKKEYLTKEIERKEEELKQVEIRHRQHEERLKEEIEALKDQKQKRDK